MKHLVGKKIMPEIFWWILGLIMMSGLYFLLNSDGMKKYIILLVLSLILMFFGRNKQRSMEAVLCVAFPAMCYLLVGCIATLFNANPQLTSVKDVFFWSIPIIFSSSLYIFCGESLERVMDFQFVGSCVVYLYSCRYWLIWYGKAEDSFAFVFGAFFIYYAYKKRWWLLPIIAIFMFFTDKKIAFLAVFVAIGVLAFLWGLKKSKIVAITIWSLGVSGIFYYIYLIRSGILKYLCYSMMIAGNGRMTMYDRFKNMYEFSPFFIGKGLGSVKNILDCWAIPTYEHLHNDLLKFYIELGFIGFLIYFVSFGVTFHIVEKRFGKTQMCGLMAMAVYHMILLMTDNVSVYVLYLVPMYCICIAMIVSEEKQKMGLRKTSGHDKIK